MISGNWRNRGQWYDATVTTVTHGARSCTYRVTYLDGFVENNVPERQVKTRRCKQYSTCDRVEVNYMGRGRWYAGRVTARRGVCAAAIYNVKFDDGDQEQRVPSGRLRTLHVAPRRPFLVNDRVMGNYRGRGRWYAGVVTRIINACCYAIRYTDGDTETCLDPVLMRRVPRGACQDSTRRPCRTGFRAQANWNGYGRYYAAQVVSCTAGAFSLRYADGDTETMVPGSRLRACQPPPTCNRALLTFARAANVFCNWQSRGNWFAARVQAVNTSTCTYVIYYSDGDRENDVPPARVCPRPARYRVNQRVTANWRARGQFFAGVITRLNPDGTYFVTYGDGDREAKVPCGLIRIRA